MRSGKRTDLQGGGFLVPASGCVLKRLETPYLYDTRSDQLYELDEEAFAYLASSPSVAATPAEAGARELVRYCFDEGLLRVADAREETHIPSPPPPPSLRYLLVHITDRCNLTCRHCFIGPQKGRTLPTEEVLSVAGEFARLQGLRFIVSGGEPLLHPRFDKINERLPDYPFRSILLTNGTLIDGAAAGRLRFHEIQVSIDGLEDAHDAIRGRGSYRRALQGLRYLAGTDVALSVATMVHRANLHQFDELQRVLEEFPLKSWSVDVPCLTGNLAEHPLAAAPPQEAATRLSYSFGGGYYGSSGSYACGSHLAAVMADASLCKCGHYAKRRSGSLREGLETVWRRVRPMPLEELDCRCSQLDSCRGGCRFRAELFSCLSAPDPIQCYARGMPLGGDLKAADPDRFPTLKGGEHS